MDEFRETARDIVAALAEVYPQIPLPSRDDSFLPESEPIAFGNNDVLIMLARKRSTWFWLSLS